MSDRFIDWLFDTLISVDVQHQELLRGFGVLLLIPVALFLLSYARVSFAFTKDRTRKGTLDTVTRVLAAELGPRNIRLNSIAPAASRPKGCMRRASPRSRSRCARVEQRKKFSNSDQGEQSHDQSDFQARQNALATKRPCTDHD